jgi:hypothetical protein
MTLTASVNGVAISVSQGKDGLWHCPGGQTILNPERAVETALMDALEDAGVTLNVELYAKIQKTATIAVSAKRLRMGRGAVA